MTPNPCRDAWGAQAVALGAWEAAAATGAVPPVTRLVALARRRWGRRVDLLVALWLLGLGAHFYRCPK